MKVIITDGGRKAAGFKGEARGDCVARAVAIASGRDYSEVYKRLAAGTGAQRATKRTGKRRASASDGICVKRKWFRDYMAELGFVWTPTMGIGTGCTVHLHDGELPMGRLIVSVSKHLTAVIDGTIHDNHDPQRHTIVSYPGQPDHVSRRCVYGYWRLT
jgi:hypothetical protein